MYEDTGAEATDTLRSARSPSLYVEAEVSGMCEDLLNHQPDSWQDSLLNNKKQPSMGLLNYAASAL